MTHDDNDSREPCGLRGSAWCVCRSVVPVVFGLSSRFMVDSVTLKQDVNELRKVFSSEPQLRRRRNELIRSLAAQGMKYKDIAKLSPEPLSAERIRQIVVREES